MKEIKNAGRNLLVAFLSVMVTAGMVFTLVKADDTETTPAVDSSEGGMQDLTSDEIDKIIDDLKVSTNVDNVLQRLDEIIKRAELSGNDSLKEYAQNTKSKYELQKQLDTLNSLIEAMKKKNSDIKTLDEELNKVLSVSTILEDLKGALSDEALMSLETLSEENIAKLQEVFAEVEGLVDLNDVESLSVKQRSLLDILMLDEAINQNMFEGHRLEVAKDALSVAVTLLKSYQKQEYSSYEYDALVEGSEEFANKGKKAAGVFPEQVILFNGTFNLKHAPIMYDGHILVAIDDLYQYIDATVEYMYNNATLVIQSQNKILEITSGKNVAYLNDEPKNMAVPVMNVKDTIYMPAEFFAETYDISYRFISSLQTIVMYKNLNQLSDPSTPNEINNN